MQFMVDGDAAVALAELAHERWNEASCERLEPVRPVGNTWPDGIEPDFTGVTVGVARTQPEMQERDEAREIEALYLRAIGSAERLIYIENQYLTSDAIAQALVKRLGERPDLEVVLVSPRTPHGWMEAKTMGVGRLRFWQHIEKAGFAERVRLVAPVVTDKDGKPVDVMVHAKALFVDDRLMTVGSANLNNRSMGFDSECNLAIEGTDDDLRQRIAAVRNSLLAEHLGLSVDEVKRRLEDESGSVLALIDGAAEAPRRLQLIDDSERVDDLLASTVAPLADPERPLDPGQMVLDLFGGVATGEVRPWIHKAAAAAAVVLAFVALWRWTPLSHYADIDVLQPIFDRISDSAYAPAAILMIFVRRWRDLLPCHGADHAYGHRLRPGMGGRLFRGRRHGQRGGGLPAGTAPGSAGAAPDDRQAPQYGRPRHRPTRHPCGDDAAGGTGGSVHRHQPGLRRGPHPLHRLHGRQPARYGAGDRGAHPAGRPPAHHPGQSDAEGDLHRRRDRRAVDRARHRPSEAARHGAQAPQGGWESLVNVAPVRVATYNVHGCVGRDGIFAPERIARVIAEIDADVVALQEMASGTDADPHAARELLGGEFGGQAVWAPTLDRGAWDFGNMLLSRWPVVSSALIDLALVRREPRNAISARLSAPFGTFHVVATHLGLKADERNEQAVRLRQTVSESPVGEPVVMMGDLNAWHPFSHLLRTLRPVLTQPEAVATFPARWPLLALDRILLRMPGGRGTVHRHASALARVASDHLPLVAEISFPGK